MRWPNVETNNRWPFESIYYGSGKSWATPGRVDVDSSRYSMSEVLRDIALLGGNIDDITDTTLMHVSRSVCYEMQVSVTAEPIAQLAELRRITLTDEFLTSLVDRASANMVGAALVGAFRAIGWTAIKAGPRALRIHISQRARDEARRARLVGGHASLVADDAHAHLWTAEHMVLPADEPQRSELLRLQQVIAAQGCLLLAAAFATALLEPWNPFVRHRLFAERQEHRRVATLLAAEARDLWQTVESAASQLETRWAEATAVWRKMIDDRKYHDIDSYFLCRREAPPAQSVTELERSAAGLCEQEPRWRRLV